MRPCRLIAVLWCAIVLFPSATHAQSPREQLSQMVAQLQATPANDSLRVHIIKLAVTLDPAPVVPKEAIAFEGRAQYAFSHAASPDDYLAAAREYENAVAIAPWVCGYYSDLCTIYEKGGALEKARRCCELSLAGLSDAAQITDMERRIAGLSYGIEQNSPAVAAARERARDEVLVKSLDGAVYTNTHESADGESAWTTEFHVQGTTILEVLRTLRVRKGSGDEAVGDYAGRVRTYTYPIKGRRFVDGNETFEIAPDGETISGGVLRAAYDRRR